MNDAKIDVGNKSAINIITNYWFTGPGQRYSSFTSMEIGIERWTRAEAVRGRVPVKRAVCKVTSRWRQVSDRLREMRDGAAWEKVMSVAFYRHHSFHAIASRSSPQLDPAQTLRPFSVQKLKGNTETNISPTFGGGCSNVCKNQDSAVDNMLVLVIILASVHQNHYSL